MKKIVCAALSLCLLLVGCGNGNVQEPTVETKNVSAVEEADAVTTAPDVQTEVPAEETVFSMTYQDVEIKLHAPAAPIIEALGEPKKYTESASCAFDGLDKTYYYGSFYLDTYPQGEEDFVYGWWFADDSMTTAEGIYIGASQADVESAYSADTFNGTNAYIVKQNDGVLTVILEDGVVTSIQYAIHLN